MTVASQSLALAWAASPLGLDVARLGTERDGLAAQLARFLLFSPTRREEGMAYESGGRERIRLVAREPVRNVTWRWHKHVILFKSRFPVSAEPCFPNSTTPSILHAVSNQFLVPKARS